MHLQINKSLFADILIARRLAIGHAYKFSVSIIPCAPIFCQYLYAFGESGPLIQAVGRNLGKHQQGVLTGFPSFHFGSIRWLFAKVTNRQAGRRVKRHRERFSHTGWLHCRRPFGFSAVFFWSAQPLSRHSSSTPVGPPLVFMEPPVTCILDRIKRRL